MLQLENHFCSRRSSAGMWWQWPPLPAFSASSSQPSGSSDCLEGAAAATQDRTASLHFGITSMLGRVSLSSLLEVRCETCGTCTLAPVGRSQPSLAGLAGCGLHQPCERGISVPTSPGAGQRRDLRRARAAVCAPHLPLPVLRVHGQ